MDTAQQIAATAIEAAYRRKIYDTLTTLILDGLYTPQEPERRLIIDHLSTNSGYLEGVYTTARIVGISSTHLNVLITAGVEALAAAIHEELGKPEAGYYGKKIQMNTKCYRVIYDVDTLYQYGATALIEKHLPAAIEAMKATAY